MERWWLFHSDVLCVRRIGGIRTRDLPAPSRARYRTAPQSARAFLPTGGDGTPLREPCDRRTCPACGENVTFMPHPRRAPSRIRTGDAHLRKVALYPLSYRGVCRRIGDVATRLPIRRHLHHLFANHHGVAICHDFRILGRWCLMCVPHSRFDLCTWPPEQTEVLRQPDGISPPQPADRRL